MTSSPNLGHQSKVQSHRVKANYEWYQLSMNACYEWLVSYLNKSEKNIALLKDVLDFDLQPHPGAGNYESGVMIWMSTRQGTCGPNMNDFGYVITEIYTTWETLTKTFLGVLDFDLQPHPGAGTLGSEVMMWIPTLQGNYGPNINAFWDIHHWGNFNLT